MKKNYNQKLINNLRDLQKKFIKLMESLKISQIKTKSVETKNDKKRREAFPKSSPLDHSKKQTNKPITPAEIVSQILPLLAEGKVEESLKIHRLNSNKTTKSRFLNALNHAENNQRKSLWASSFCCDTHAKTNYRQKPRVKFTPFQYWSQGPLPSDLKKIQEKWDNILLEIGLPAIKTFSKSSAKEWITFHTPEFIKPFEKAPFYAVEADIFRIAFALHNDCIWIDSDQYPRQNTGQLIQQRGNDCDTLLMFRWNRPWITNSFFLTKKASPLFQKIFNKSLSYEFPASGAMTRNEVLRSFGPGRYNTILNNIIRENPIQTLSTSNHPLKSQLTSAEGWRYAFLNEKNLSALKPPFKLSYESTKDSWHNNVE